MGIFSKIGTGVGISFIFSFLMLTWPLWLFLFLIYWFLIRGAKVIKGGVKVIKKNI